MTNQEFDRELNALMEGDEKSRGEKKKRGFFWKRWSRKKRVGGAAALAAAALLAARGILGGGGQTASAAASTLSRGSIQEVLSITGPVSGADSAEVVSRLHAEILELLVKEGDRVEAGQVLARLDPTDIQKEVDMAQNDYEIAQANWEEAQKEAELGYEGAVQKQQAARLDYDRKSALFEAGGVALTELEAARDALEDAARQTASYRVENGRPMAEKSYELQAQKARYALEQKKEELEDVEVVSPIEGTVVRVNSRVGRFADTVDDDKPLFVIDNLDQLEMKISVSEYSIGKVKVGQEAQITADILEGAEEKGVITAISPTGEEKGGGSSERVIPTTIQIETPDTKLIAGITARARIVLNQADNVWVVPVAAVLERDGETLLATAENGWLHLIPVETGVESDVETEILGDGLSEGLVYLTAPDPSVQEGMEIIPILDRQGEKSA